MTASSSKQAASPAVVRHDRSPAAGWRQQARDIWFVALAAIVFAMPGLVMLARQVWSTEQGAQGPIILTTGSWLLWREWRKMPNTSSQGRGVFVAAGLAAMGATYVFASIINKIWLTWASAYACLVLVLYQYVGTAGLRRLWFPLFYLLFLIPPPDSIIVPLTRSLKIGIAHTAVDIMAGFGFAVASNGAQIYVDGYELVVAAACSGLNSLTSLLAIGLFYIYLRHRADWRYAFILAVLVIPIALFANLVRVLILISITHFLGDAAAQGGLHDAAGMMFFVALLTLMGADLVLGPLRERLARSEEPS
ncbi:exosortase V [Sphingomonas sp. Leaf343]|uniref:exosortase V n=1 Tax=Sphingomonas sp. Leaf343 TaxID=1736345 RepID=UPI000701DA72|nr:exosortase V [Sphingomonas sp. Leaf343]KQR80203.1 hypothetical protein ASG07_15530 [Sphingomonas sp. Leaf343]